MTEESAVEKYVPYATLLRHQPKMNIWSNSWTKTDSEIFVCTVVIKTNHFTSQKYGIFSDTAVSNLISRSNCEEFCLWDMKSCSLSHLYWRVLGFNHPQLLTSAKGFLLDSWHVKMGPMGCPEKSESNYYYSLPNVILLHSVSFQPSCYLFRFIQ